MKEKFSKLIQSIKITPMFVICLSFLAVILIGSGLLCLPFAYQEGQDISYIDALFTATTSTCVTGLVSVYDGVGGTYTLFGYIVVGFLIQIGGLGVTTFAVFFFMLVSNKISFSNRTLIKESWNLKSLKSLRKVFFYVLLVTFSIELFGAILSFIDFYLIHHFPVDEAIGYAIFHSVSAFNNAGIDLFGNQSLIAYQDDILLNLTTCFLIIMGGIGFFVIVDIVSKKFNLKHCTSHTKVVLTYTAFLLVVGTLLIYLCELNNPNATNYGGTSFLGAFFMSTSSRTAGFSLYDLSTYRDATLFVIIALMFIGASPGGTGGGIKTATVAVLLSYFRGLIINKKPSLYKRSLSDDLIKKAFLIFSLGLSVFLLGLFLVCVFEGNYNYILNGEKILSYEEGAIRFSFIDYAFECMSAFGTVGLSTGFTPYYSIGSKIVLILLMYLGRVGPLSIYTAVRRKSTQKFYYVTEDIQIG